MPTNTRVVRISPDALGDLLDRARAERWSRLVLYGPGTSAGNETEDGPAPLQTEDQNFQLTGVVGGRAGRLATLTSLTSLDLSDNSIGAGGAMAIAASLIGLTSLNLSGNSIGADGARAIAASLTGLASLDLRLNGIGADGARAIAASLTGLTSLDLSVNSIGDDGARAILDAWSSRAGNQLRHLNLLRNPGLADLLPQEVLETTDAQAILAAYRRFAAAARSQTLRPLNELKLLVVGNEAVGKTSLLRYMIENRPRDPGEAKTPGIVQHERIRIQAWAPIDCQVQLDVWDFGGQEMMRGTHRFFLTERSLYLLVLEDRRQDDRSIYDWMKTIRNRGGESPVIIVINKSDDGKQHLRLDEPGLRDAYPNIVAFLRTSCDPGEWGANSIAALRRQIVEVITTDQRLRHVSDGIPANWLRIKDTVSDLASQRSVLTHADYVALCGRPGDGNEPVTDPNEQRALLQLLHQLGTIVAHGLERDASAARREVSLLDPNWLTGAVYRILDKAGTADQHGEFLRHELAEWLDPAPYPAERHEFILDMMQDTEIGLCFRVPVPREERYLVPEALPASRPYLGQRFDDLLRLRYQYDYLPPGLIPRLIVEAHRNVMPELPRWRSGVLLAARDCQVLVLAHPDRRRIDLEVDGPPALRRSALNIVLNDLETVHGLNPEAGPVARVPLPDHPEKDVSYDHLLVLEQRSGRDHWYLPEGAEHEYEVGKLLDGVGRGLGPDGCHRSHDARDTVILIHGIRTRALYHASIRRTLESAGFRVELTNYGRFDLLRFLCPGPFFRGPIVDEVAKQIRHAIEPAGSGPCSIIAHSFGTFVVADMLRRHTDLKFRRIIFCGSVVPHGFRFEEYRHRFEDPLINEVGTRDVWPVLAEGATTGYGSAGTYGFRRPGVRDRWHNGKTHSAFLQPEFCKRYWVPYLLARISHTG